MNPRAPASGPSPSADPARPSPNRCRCRPGCRAARIAVAIAVLAFVATATPAFPEDWPMLGRDRTRNPVSPEKGPPTDWDVKTGRNIRWKARLGSITVSSPIVAGGLVWIGTNNDPPRDPARPEPAGILACFREADGAFLYQHYSTVTNPVGRLQRRCEFGMTGTPMADGDRLWFVSTTAELVCFDIAPLQKGEPSPRRVWRVDTTADLGVFPTIDIMGGRGMTSLSTPHGNLLHAITGNGTDRTWINVPAPQAPALVAVDKLTGKAVWEDASPGTNILFGEFGSPLVIEAGGVAQVIAPQGDGWVRSFEAATGKPLWKFDINPKAVRKRFDRNSFQNSPVYHGGRVYVAGGRGVDAGEGPGRLVCLDPTRRGDLSLELEDPPGSVRPNPNSGAVWHFDGLGSTMSNPAIRDGRVVAVDFGGYVHCLDAADGRRLWKYDVRAQVWGSPLVVDGRVYLGDGDGILHILSQDGEERLIARHAFPSEIYSSPVFANGVLYIADSGYLYAIREGGDTSPPADRAAQPAPR